METLLRPISLDPFSLTTTTTALDSFVDMGTPKYNHHYHLHLSPDSVLSRSFSVDSTSSSSRLFLHRSPWRHTSFNASPFLPRPSQRPSPSPREITHKYLCFWVPLYRRVKAMRWGPLGTHKEEGKRRGCGGGGGEEVRRRKSGSKSESFSRMDEYCRQNSRVRAFDAFVEKSIHEAVLHCKKSIGEGPSVERINGRNAYTQRIKQQTQLLGKPKLTL